MKIDVPDEYIPLMITALDHYFAYTVAARREDYKVPGGVGLLSPDGAARTGQGNGGTRV